MPTPCAVAFLCVSLAAGLASAAERNLAMHAVPSTSFVSGHETLAAVNDGFEPDGRNDHRHGAYGNWPESGWQWVELQWDQAIRTARIDVYWWDDNRGVRLPVACRLLAWDGTRLAPVAGVEGLGVVGGRYNSSAFPAISTSRLRLEFQSQPKFSTGILEWKVYDAGGSPAFPPKVEAGPDRVTVLPAATFLHGSIRGPWQSAAWRRASGPGEVKFDNADTLETTARFSVPGRYQLTLLARDGDQAGTDTLTVRVEEPVAATGLAPVATTAYAVSGPFWPERLKQQVVHWIPHCVAELSKPDLKEGGIENFVQTANKLAGRPHKPHVGPPWSNAYALNTLESICLALLLDPQSDEQLRHGQDEIRATLDRWVPLILAAQEPDGYFQTRFTLGTGGEKTPPSRWTRVGDHEGYVAGYFIDAAVAHWWLTGGRDRRLYDAARRLADCWDRNIGPPPKRAWYDGHEALEQALVRLARLVDEVDGPGAGQKYLRLSRFLLDCRRGGSSYDQSHLPVIQQYEALGHSVRAAYCYAAMADVAHLTGDPHYHSAVRSIWDNLVNRKLYVTGGLGSGETSEGFGPDYSLPNNGYCESCANCGQLFFQHKMGLAYAQGLYADLMEEAIYNAILGSVDLPAKTFTYTNPLDQTHARYLWHGCPCCVGNIPRTLLMLPTWAYAKGADRLLVNLYLGGRTRVGRVAGAEVEIVQRTEYPWKEPVEIEVRPERPVEFTLSLRAPGRSASAIYRVQPQADGLADLSLNGQPLRLDVKQGYVAIRRTWMPGDTLRFRLPLAVQIVAADPRVAAARGRVALRYGPLVYNFEAVDQDVEKMFCPDSTVQARWEPQLLGGVVALRGQWADGSPLLAVPNYARNNRGGRSLVWIKVQPK